MRRWQQRTTLSMLFCLTAVSGAGALAADKPGHGNKQMGESAQKVIANPNGMEKVNGVKTLQDYIVQEKELFDYLFQNHPVFKYQEQGKLIGMYKVSDRGEEYMDQGNGQKYSKRVGRPSAVQYRLAAKSILDFPISLLALRSAVSVTRCSMRSGSAPVTPRPYVSPVNTRKWTMI